MTQNKFDDYQRVENAAKDLIRAIVWESFDIAAGEDESVVEDFLKECNKEMATNLIEGVLTDCKVKYDKMKLMSDTKVYVVSEYSTEDVDKEINQVIGVFTSKGKAENAAEIRFNDFTKNYDIDAWREMIPETWCATHKRGWAFCHIDIKVTERVVK